MRSVREAVWSRAKFESPQAHSPLASHFHLQSSQRDAFKNKHSAVRALSLVVKPPLVSLSVAFTSASRAFRCFSLFSSFRIIFFKIVTRRRANTNDGVCLQRSEKKTTIIRKTSSPRARCSESVPRSSSSARRLPRRFFSAV